MYLAPGYLTVLIYIFIEIVIERGEKDEQCNNAMGQWFSGLIFR